MQKMKGNNLMPFQLPDPSSEFGQRVARRLREEIVIWLTTVDLKGTPQPAPVWFLWDDATGTILIYSRNDAKRLAHIQQNPRVSLHFNSTDDGDDVIVITGTAEINASGPLADQVPAYVAKYGRRAADLFSRPEDFVSLYSVPLRIHPTAIRGF